MIATSSSIERRAVFLVVIVMTTLWSCSQGITTLTGANNYAFLPRQMVATSNCFLKTEEQQSISTSSSSSSSLALRVRGGETVEGEEESDDDEEEVAAIATHTSSDDGSLVVNKLRNIIRSLLQISDNKGLGMVSGLLRSLFRIIESVTGMELLPPPEEEKPKKKSKSKSKSKSSSSKSKAKSKSKSKSKPKLKAASATTKKHLDTNIKSTNPNYRIQKELKAFLKSPPDNLSVQVGSNIRLWIVTMIGAKGTIYEGEVFKLRIEFPKDYPTVPPSVYFLKKFIPLHEHVYTNGDICLSLLGNGWRPTMSAQSIAVSILSILSSAQSKNLPMDNANHAGNKPGQYQKDWVYHDDNC